MTAATSSGFTMQKGGVKTGMTALSGGTVPLLAANMLDAINVVSTVAADGDSVMLPSNTTKGTLCWVFNQDSAQDINVWPNVGATILGGTATTGDCAVGQTQGAVFVQLADDGLTWMGLLGAVFVPV